MTKEERALEVIDRGEASIELLFEFVNDPPSGSPRVRNAAAVALADRRAHGAAEVLIALLKKPETKDARGTLLYALEEMEAKVPLSILISIIDEGGYEAREMALDLISESRYSVDSKEQKRDLIIRLFEISRHKDDPELRDEIREVTEFLGTVS